MSELAAGWPLIFGVAFLWTIFTGVVVGATGFAGAPVALPVLLLLYGVKPAVVIVLIMMVVGTAPIVWRDWNFIVPRALVPITLGTLVGAPLGVVLLAAADARALQLAIGFVSILFAILMLTGRRWRMKCPVLVGAAAGVASGAV